MWLKFASALLVVMATVPAADAPHLPAAPPGAVPGLAPGAEPAIAIPPVPCLGCSWRNPPT